MTQLCLLNRIKSKYMHDSTASKVPSFFGLVYDTSQSRDALVEVFYTSIPSTLPKSSCPSNVLYCDSSSLSPSPPRTTPTPPSRFGSGRLSWSKRPSQQTRSWARVSLGGFAPGRRRDKEPKGLAPRSPSRRTTLGGALREDGVGAGGAAYHGRHGIRYQKPQLDTQLDTRSDDSKGEVGHFGLSWLVFLFSCVCWGG